MSVYLQALPLEHRISAIESHVVIVDAVSEIHDWTLAESFQAKDSDTAPG